MHSAIARLNSHYLLFEKESVMKAFIVDRYGKSELLRAVELPEPELLEDEVLVKAHAASVNVLDAKIRNGEFKLVLPYRTPFVLGHDVAGVVVRVGSRVRQFKPGDEVYARPDDFRIGTFAEFVAVRESALAPKPANISMEEAASLPLVGLTAWQALVEKGGAEKKSEGVHSGRVGRRRQLRHSACQTFGSRSGHHGQRRKCGLGEGVGSRCRD